MTNETMPPLTPREFFSFVKRRIGDGYLLTLWHCDRRTLDRWLSDRRFVSSEGFRRNPLEKIEEMLEVLVERGHVTEARAMVHRLARIVGSDLDNEGDDVPDKDTLLEELLDTYPAISRMHQAIQEGEQPDVVEHYMHEALSEVKQDFTAYCQGYPMAGLKAVRK